MAKKLSGWQKAGLFAGVGCLSIIAVVVLGVVIASMWARATIANLGDTKPERVERRIVLPSGSLTAERPPVAEKGRGPLRLTLDLREGEFTVRPGERGTAIQIQGTYSPALYELVENHETDSTGLQRSTVRFRSKAPAWARFFASMGDESQRPQLTITIPRAAPIDLSLQVGMGRSDVDLGGLSLGEVSVNAAMGEHRIDFREPVAEAIRHLRLSASMGNVSVDHLGNARAATVTTTGNMGNLTADLGGAWEPGSTADLTFEQSMGELTVRVPSDVRVDADVRSSDRDGGARPPDIKQPDDPKAPTLHLRVTTSMGNSRVIQY